MRHPRLWLLLVVLLLSFTPSATAQTDERCFAETGFCMRGRIRQFWEQNGGLPVFGLPTGPQEEQLIEGKPYQVQWFERNRLELHPENAAPYDVLIGRLGADRLAQQGRDWRSIPATPPAPQDTCRLFAETGHAICGPILAVWRASGLELDGQPGASEAESLALFGLPLSPLLTETIQGREYQVQWFERARFELHPENAPPADVLLGLLGNEVRAGSTPAPAPTPGPEPEPEPCVGVPAASNGEMRPACPRAGRAFEAVGKGFRPDERVDFSVLVPDGTRQELPVLAGPSKTDANGEYRLRAAMSLQTAPGEYVLHMKGRKGRLDVFIPFRVLPPDPSNPGGDESVIPAGLNAKVTPASGARGTKHSFTTTGFQPGERVRMYVTWPDGTVIDASFRVTADNSGNVGQGVRFLTEEDDPVGIFKLTFEAIDSGTKAIAYLRVFP